LWNFSVTYTIAVCTVKNSWWWAEEQSETCRVLFHYLCPCICQGWSSTKLYPDKHGRGFGGF